MMKYMQSMNVIWKKHSGNHLMINNMKNRNGKKIRYRLIAALILFGGSLVLSVASSWIQGFASWHAVHIYPFLVSTIGRISGFFSFSLCEILLYLLVISLIFTFIQAVRKTRRLLWQQKEKTCFSDSDMNNEKASVWMVSWFSGVLLGAGILIFLYVICCGINYKRTSFSEESGLMPMEYSTEELKEICIQLTEKLNELSDKVARDENGIMILSGQADEKAISAMASLGEEYDVLSGYYPRPKQLIISELLSYQGLSGIYLPFTVEANYNGDMIPYNIPFTACHELFHLRGFMQEDEANFIAFLACIHDEDLDFQYSGYMLGWTYCMNALYRMDHELWSEVRVLLDEVIETDLLANNEFWDSYEGVISEVSNQMNDLYLKANGESEGVQSYSRIVELIVAYYNN